MKPSRSTGAFSLHSPFSAEWLVLLAGALIASVSVAQPGNESLAPPNELSAAAPAVRWTTRAALVGQDYQWTLQRGALDLGLRTAAPASAVRTFDARAISTLPFDNPLPVISLGLRREGTGYSSSAGSLLERATHRVREDATSSKVGLQWKPAEPQVRFLREGLGFRFDGTDQMTVRLRKGVLGVYMQRKF